MVGLIADQERHNGRGMETSHAYIKSWERRQGPKWSIIEIEKKNGLNVQQDRENRAVI